MSRWFWALLAFSAVIFAVVMAIARPGGSVSHESFAHIYTPVAEPGPPVFHASIDANATNGTAPCAPIDTTTDVLLGPHEVAVCIESADTALGALAFALNFDTDFNTCSDVNCAAGDCLDDNPDANAGATLGSGVPTTPALGTGWDCNIMDLAQPTCAKDAIAGKAWIGCWSLTGPYTSPVGPDVAFPLAVVTFNAVGLGTDALTLSDVILGDTAGGEVGSCYPVSSVSMPCYGADVEKVTPIPATPTNTPTITPTPEPSTRKRSTSTPIPEPTATATRVAPTAAPPTVPPPPPAAATPLGGAGPAIVPPATGSGPSDGGSAWAVWLAAGIAGAAVATGGLYLRRKAR